LADTTEQVFEESFENDDVTACVVGRNDGTIDLLIQDFDGDLRLIFDRETGLAFCAWLVTQIDRLRAVAKDEGKPEDSPSH
jgi:hypothetical protein